METIGSSKAKQNALPKKYTLEDWKKEADAARKRAEYWKNQSISWEHKYFVFQENVNTEIDAIGADLDAALSSLKEAKTSLKWAHEGNQELLERCKNAEALELAIKAEIKVKNVEISLLKSDFETKQSELEIIEEDYNALKLETRHTKTLAWVGWIMFFISIFGMIFLRN
jgi:predicted RNase H-like nuclease (RuvC/YqgF family)